MSRTQLTPFFKYFWHVCSRSQYNSPCNQVDELDKQIEGATFFRILAPTVYAVHFLTARWLQLRSTIVDVVYQCIGVGSFRLQLLFVIFPRDPFFSLLSSQIFFLSFSSTNLIEIETTG